MRDARYKEFLCFKYEKLGEIVLLTACKYVLYMRIGNVAALFNGLFVFKIR